MCKKIYELVNKFRQIQFPLDTVSYNEELKL